MAKPASTSFNFQQSSPLTSLFRRTSESKRKLDAVALASATATAAATSIVVPHSQSSYEHQPSTSPFSQYSPEPLTQYPSSKGPVPPSPLLHGRFRASTATETTNFDDSINSRHSPHASVTEYYDESHEGDFLRYYEDGGEDGGGLDDASIYSSSTYSEIPQRDSSVLGNYQDSGGRNSGVGSLYGLSSTESRFQPPMEEEDVDPYGGGAETPSSLTFDPNAIPTVVISSPTTDRRIASQAQGREPTLRPSVVNFSRPIRPPIVSHGSEEQKRAVLERNRQRSASGSSTASSPRSPLGSPSLRTQSKLSNSYTPTGERSNRLSLPKNLSSPSLGADLPPSVSSNRILPTSVVSPSPTFSRHSTPSPSSLKRPPSTPTNPTTPQQYLLLGISHHEANRLTDSAQCFEQSARLNGGCGIGMLMYGLTLRHGWGCEKNEKSGFRWLRKAAECAVDDLEKVRGGASGSGNGERGGALDGLQESKAVKKEMVLAIYEVGQCFFQGWGVPKDQKMAVSYYRVAARLGDQDAQQDLAFCLANGKGCKKDRGEAAKWYRAAVAQGASDVGLAWIYKTKFQ